MIRDGARFPVDPALVAHARSILAPLRRVVFVVGGAGSGKSTVCAEIGRRAGVDVIDVDTLLYGAWFGRFTADRHPASHAWASAADPLAWQLALEPDAFLAFHAATTAEQLDLIATDLADRDPDAPLLVDGGFGRPAVVAAAVGPARIACVALPVSMQAAVWTGSDERRGFLAAVASMALPDCRDPVAAFMALDARLHAAMVSDAHATGIAVCERDATTTVGDLARGVADALRIRLDGPAGH